MRYAGKYLIFLIILAALLCPCNAEETAMVINGDKIYRDEYDYALARYQDSYRTYFGLNMDQEVLEKMKKELADDLIERQLYVQEARRRGITAKVFAGEEEIEDLMMKNPIFYTDGRFDEAKYSQLNSGGSKELKAIRDRAETVILNDKIRQILPSKVIAAIKEDVSVSDKEVLDEYLKRAEKMRVRYLTIDTVPMANNLTVSEDDIRAYYERNKDRFAAPEGARYAALYFDPDDFADMASVTESMAKDYYDAHREEYKEPKLVKVRYVLFRTKDHVNKIYDTGVNSRQYYEENIDQYVEPAEARIRFISIKKPCDKAKIAALMSELKQGADFPDIAKKYSEDPITADNGGDLGYIKAGTLKEPYNGIAFSLSAGQNSGIIETENSCSVIYVEDKRDEHVAPFEEVKDAIEEKLLNESAKPLAMASAKRFKIEARKMGFERTAEKQGMTVYETDYFKSTDRIPSIGTNTAFTAAAFSLASGEVSAEIDCEGGYAVLMVSDIRQGDYLPYPDVAVNIERKIMSENSWAYAESAAKHVLDMVSEGMTPDSIKTKVNVHVFVMTVHSSSEAPTEVGSVIKKSNGYYLIIPASDNKQNIADIKQVSFEVASALALEMADKLASEEADRLLASGAVTGEAAVETPPFSRNDYVIAGEYMKPFIEQCFLMWPKQVKVVKTPGKYYVVQVAERGIKLTGYDDESPVIKSQVLKEKRTKYVDDWLRDEKEKAVIQVNL